MEDEDKQILYKMLAEKDEIISTLQERLEKLAHEYKKYQAKTEEIIKCLTRNLAD